MLSITGLHKVYHGHGRTVTAIGDLTFTVDSGSFVCVVGPSGCGKTTLLRCIAALMQPDVGAVLHRGQPFDNPPSWLSIDFANV